MGLRSSGRKLSFDVLCEAASSEDASDSRVFLRSNSLPTHHHTEVSLPKNRKRNKHKKKKKKLASPEFAVISEDPVSDSNAVNSSTVVFENWSAVNVNCQSYVCASSTTTVVTSESGYNNCGELRQRNMNGNEEVESREEESSTEKQQQRSNEANQSVVTKLETAESLDWKRLMAEDPNCKQTNNLCSFVVLF